MLRRLYVHNFRCLENFELSIGQQPSALLIGKNGAGKTTVGLALEIFQKIARGTNRVRDLVSPKDLTRGRTEVPLRFEIEVEVEKSIYVYSLALEFPNSFKELRVLEEKLTWAGNVVYSRHLANVQLTRTSANFVIDWHLVALPIIQDQASDGPLFLFKQWLSRMLILQPLPGLMKGDSSGETLEPAKDGSDFGSWFSGVLAHAPAAYGKIDQYLREVMPDFKDIKNPTVGTETRSMVVQFSTEIGSLILPLEELSDGEKCFMLCALVLAANSAYGPLFCFWDEPDNHLALSEVGQFLTALRREFQSTGQLITTSHNPEAIRRFSDENTFLIARRSHLEPPTIRALSDIPRTGDLITSLLLGDLES